MKKFKFSLQTVHKYKNQILDSLKNEHAQIILKIVEAEDELNVLENERLDLNNELYEKNKKGSTILEITNFKRYLKILDNKIKEQCDVIEKLKVEEAEKRAEVIEARKETASLDLLKEKKLEEYNKALAKNEEILIDEFVSNKLFAEKNH